MDKVINSAANYPVHTSKTMTIISVNEILPFEAVKSMATVKFI